jgi:hypothetical protein
MVDLPFLRGMPSSTSEYTRSPVAGSSSKASFRNTCCQASNSSGWPAHRPFVCRTCSKQKAPTRGPSLGLGGSSHRSPATGSM